MPAVNLPSINISGDDFKSQETMNQILDTLQKYRKELNFLLMNLDSENMPAIAGVLKDYDGNFSIINQEIDQITLAVGDNAGNIASLVITAQEIQTQVSDNAGNISTLTQTAQGLQSTVSSHSTTIGSHSTQITQLSNQINLKVTAGDVVNMLNINQSGLQINANNIDLTGITHIYDPMSTRNYARINGAVLEIVEQNTVLFSIQPFGSSVALWGRGYNIDIASGLDVSGYSYLNGAKFYGTVDFSSANVIGIDTGGSGDEIRAYWATNRFYADLDESNMRLTIRGRDGLVKGYIPIN